MLNALSQDKQILRASPNITGYCPDCGEKITPKCGQIKIHHWSHKPGGQCQYGSGETEWHLRWKSYTSPENCEVKIGNHRADIRNDNGLVIELQHSNMSIDVIREREEAYDNMIWLLDCNDCDITFTGVARTVAVAVERSLYYYTWKYAKQAWASCTRPLFLDVGNKVLQIHSISKGTIKFFYAFELSKQEFINKYITLSEPVVDFWTAIQKAEQVAKEDRDNIIAERRLKKLHEEQQKKLARAEQEHREYLESQKPRELKTFEEKARQIIWEWHCKDAGKTDTEISADIDRLIATPIAERKVRLNKLNERSVLVKRLEGYFNLHKC